jgi:hypothetical protein
MRGDRRPVVSAASPTPVKSNKVKKPDVETPAEEITTDDHASHGGSRGQLYVPPDVRRFNLKLLAKNITIYRKMEISSGDLDPTSPRHMERLEKYCQATQVQASP